MGDMDIDRLEGPDLVRAVLEARGIRCYGVKEGVAFNAPVPHALQCEAYGGATTYHIVEAHRSGPYDPTTDLNQAWELMKEMAATRGVTSIRLWHSGGLEVCCGDDIRPVLAADDVGVAICRVFLKAKASK